MKRIFAGSVLVFAATMTTAAVSGDMPVVLSTQDNDDQQIDREKKIQKMAEIQKYADLALRAREKSEQIRINIMNDVPGKGLEAIPEDDKRLQHMKDEQQKEQDYLDKLIELDPDNPEHKFNYAMLAFTKGERRSGESLMLAIAPLDQPGYTKAHLFLSKLYLKRKHRTEGAKQYDLQMAEKHIDHFLAIDASNNDARRLKAFILNQNKEYAKSYQMYLDLFDDDPIHYRHLLRLSSILGRHSDRNDILERGSRKFRARIENNPSNVAVWVDAWTNYVYCMKSRQDFSQVEEELNSEIQQFPGDVGKTVFLKRQLSRVYSDRAISRGRHGSVEVQKQQLSDLANAIGSDAKNETALQWLTVVGFSSAVGDEARKIYDPRSDPDAPWIVLSELGSQAIRQNDTAEAIKFRSVQRKETSVPADPEQPCIFVPDVRRTRPGTSLASSRSGDTFSQRHRPWITSRSHPVQFL